jgi:hypothetical protein
MLVELALEVGLARELGGRPGAARDRSWGHAAVSRTLVEVALRELVGGVGLVAVIAVDVSPVRALAAAADCRGEPCASAGPMRVGLTFGEMVVDVELVEVAAM